MCTIAIAGLVVAAVGTGVAVYGQIQAGKARKKQEAAAAKVAQKNAAIAKENAVEVRAQGERDVARKRLETLQIISKQRAGMGANGIELDSGSALDVVMDSQMMGELDAQTIRRNAENKAQAYLQQGSNFDDQANAHLISGDNAGSAGVLGGIATGFSGVGSAISGYNSATQPSTGGNTYFDMSAPIP